MKKNFPAQFESLDVIREFVAAAAGAAGLGEPDIYNVQLAVDEAASNIVEHAYAGIKDGEIEIATEVTDAGLLITLRDQGKPFDPEQIDEPDIDAALEDRMVGGLGLFFMRKLMDELHFAYAPETGNTLTLLKRLPARPLRLPNWRELLFGLGDHILAATSFGVQRNLLLETVSRLIANAEVDLWLNEPYFHLPDWTENLFAPTPTTDSMADAHKMGKIIGYERAETFSLAIPLRREQIGLGVVEVRRRNGKKFTRREQDILEGLAQIAAISLFAWHLGSLDRWRLGQLSLVRTVSAQIANEADLDTLARRVTRLIQSTFKYYYVAIFTLGRNNTALTFRSSAGGSGGRKPMLGVSVELGQGLVGTAAATGEQIWVDDVHKDSRFRYLDSLPETQSEVVLPLKVEDQVVGVLDLQSQELGAFHARDMLVLHALADNIAIAVEGAQLYSDLRHQADQLKVVSEVSKQITSILTLHDLMDKVAAIIQQKFEYPHVHLFTVHPNRRQIHYEAGSGARAGALEGYIIPLDDPHGIVPWVARHGLPVLANDVEKEPRYRPSLLPPANTRSELTMPLVFDGQVYGVLDVQSDKLNAFTDQDALLFETLADTIASAIRNADLYRSEQWRRQVGDSLREVAVLLSANASIDQVLEAILTELERNLPSDISVIWLLDDDELYCAAVHGAQAADLDHTRRNIPEAADWLAAALAADGPVIRRPGDRMGPIPFTVGLERGHSGISVPLRIGGQAVGVLTLAHHTPGRYGHEAQDMVTTFASYAAVAIENARLYDTAQEQAYASAALLQVAQAVVSLSDLSEILGTIVRIMPILVGVRRAAIYRWDVATGFFYPQQAYGIRGEQRLLLWHPLKATQFPLLGAVLERGQTVFCEAGTSGPESWLALSPAASTVFETVAESDERLLIALPLMVKGEIFGVFLVEEATGGRRFRSRRVEILNGVTQQVALAMQNDLFQQETVTRERLEMEVQLARQIQQAFVPEHLPILPGWDVSARWRTARQVGGDFYDIIELPGERLGLFIADVADKGMPAALFMALTRTLMRAAVLQSDSPAEVLRHVNDLLYPDCEQGMFVTAVYGVLELKTGRFTYANAGHNPPLYVKRGLVQRGSGRVPVRVDPRLTGFDDVGRRSPDLRPDVERLTRTGIALGVIEHAAMTERSIDLLPGETLLLYTDGVTEAFSPSGEIYDEARLVQVLVESVSDGADALLDEIDASVNAFIADAPVSDDITLVAVKRISSTDF